MNILKSLFVFILLSAFSISNLTGQSKKDLEDDISDLKTALLRANADVKRSNRELQSLKLKHQDLKTKHEQLFLDNKTCKEGNQSITQELALALAKLKEYESLTQKIDEPVVSTFNKKSKITDVTKETPVLMNPSWYSLEYENFGSGRVKVIGIINGMYQVKSSDGRVGYIRNLSDFDYLATREVEVMMKEIDFRKGSKQPILIKSAYIHDINSVGGVNFVIEWNYFNTSKVIKYINFTVVPYNQVSDPQTCRISGHSVFTGQLTGPISGSKELRYSTWATAWYNNTISCVKLTKVSVEYLDGTSYTYVKELPKIIDEHFSNSCSVN